MASNFIYTNDTVQINENTGVSASNRSYSYGDGLFESVRLINGLPINLEQHLTRLQAGAKAVKIEFNPEWTVDFIKNIIIELAEKSEIKEGGRVKIHIDRNEGGNYIPTNNGGKLLIEIVGIESNQFELNTKGWEIDLYQELKKQVNHLSNFKTKNGLIYIMAGISATEKKYDDLLITNDKGGIIESSSSNLFVVSNGVLYTPGLEEGCLAGTMRMQIINFAIKNNIKVYECNILPQNLLSADEIFLTNAIRGVTWIGGYRTKRYFNNTARKFVAFLNDHWIED
jgi:branched-subunit amino acid aminotransferase/4-amino-4-deoxychorismate lyase